MSEPRRLQIPPRQTLLLILIPLLGTFLAMRLYLHLVGVRHIYPGGYLFHHLFTGVLIVVPSAFVLAFEVRRRWPAYLARIALGSGSAMILDEIVFLVMTRATDEDYVSGMSLSGGCLFVSLGVILLLVLYRSRRE
jgi:hypothetical protein